MVINPTVIVALNRAVVVAKVSGSAAALKEIDRIKDDSALKNYYLLPATRGRLLAEGGALDEAAACFSEALKQPCSEPERRFLLRKLEEAASDANQHKNDANLKKQKPYH